MRDAGGIPEIVQHGRTGLLGPVHKPRTGVHTVDADGLTAVTKFLLKERSLAKEMGVAGQKRVEEVFSVDAMARSTSDVYQIAIERYHREQGTLRNSLPSSAHRCETENPI
jgi:glycosyltransferase involved in cell wall biosynthesis